MKNSNCCVKFTDRPLMRVFSFFFFFFLALSCAASCQSTRYIDQILDFQGVLCSCDWFVWANFTVPKKRKSDVACERPVVGHVVGFLGCSQILGFFWERKKKAEIYNVVSLHRLFQSACVDGKCPLCPLDFRQQRLNPVLFCGCCVLRPNSVTFDLSIPDTRSHLISKEYRLCLLKWAIVCSD